MLLLNVLNVHLQGALLVVQLNMPEGNTGHLYNEEHEKRSPNWSNHVVGNKAIPEMLLTQKLYEAPTSGNFMDCSRIRMSPVGHTMKLAFPVSIFAEKCLRYTSDVFAVALKRDSASCRETGGEQPQP